MFQRTRFIGRVCSSAPVQAARTRATRILAQPRLRTRPAAALAGESSSSQSERQQDAPSDNSELYMRLRRKTRSEVITAGTRIGLKTAFLEQQLDVFESLLPNLPINVEQMRASDWARVVADPELGAKLVLIKMAFPARNVEVLLKKHPRTLLWTRQKLEENIEQVSKVLHSIPRPEVVLETLPELLDPRQCFSVVATLRKWYPKRDPLQVLQMDPDVVRRAEQWDVPLEPVFFDSSTGTWTAAGYSRNKQADWQVYIEKEIYKRKPQPIDKQEAVVVGGAGSPTAISSRGMWGGPSDTAAPELNEASAAATAPSALTPTSAPREPSAPPDAVSTNS